jgi:hypothetical protein
MRKIAYDLGLGPPMQRQAVAEFEFGLQAISLTMAPRGITPDFPHFSELIWHFGPLLNSQLTASTSTT